ncbi:MAG: DivIVA domain-containing protein [Clostridia bacterium]|nr:DivIVA domain-containing protein [Clostridia bacterium]
MLTPQEIQEQKFEKAVFGGYDMGQIDKFLDAVLSDYSSLYKENAALKAKMRVLVDKIEEYRAVDEELRKTLYNAQITAKDTVSRAQADAERILRDARTTAAKSISDLQGQVLAEEKRLEDAKRLNAAYAEKIRRAMELGIRQMEDVLAESAPAQKAEEPQTVPAPKAPVSQATAIFEKVVQAVEAEEPAEEPAEAEVPAEDMGVALDLEVPVEDPVQKTDPQSDTGRIYGDSPFTPKPRFNFNDMRFGKQYDAENDEE